MKFSKSYLFFGIGLFWIVFSGAYVLGAISFKYDLWPYNSLAEVWRFVVGVPGDDTSFMEKVLNDAGIRPTRHLVESAKLAYPASEYNRVGGLSLKKERDEPLLYLSPDAPRGYRLLYGVFDFETNLHGAVLLDPDGKVAHVWKISQNDASSAHESDTNIIPHGMEIGRDGSLLAAYANGSTLTRYGYCGEIIWRLSGEFHHSITFQDEKSFWVWHRGDLNRDVPRNNRKDGIWWDRFERDEQAQLIAFDTGKVIRQFSLQDIIDANPEIDILALRQTDETNEARWAHDPFHPNDIDPLPETLARFYPGFRAGDLVISLRSLNLVFVVDHKTLKIKWWRMGQYRRQHDPDWNDRGTITVFDNRYLRPPSNIVEIDPKNMTSRIKIDGSKYGFYSSVSGKHDELPNGNVLIASAYQGRAFEVASDGRVVFDFQNIYNKEYGSLMLMEARFLPTDYFSKLPKCNK